MGTSFNQKKKKSMIKNKPEKAIRTFTQEWSNFTWYRLRRAKPGATSASEITFQSQKAKHILWTHTKIWPEFESHVVN